MLPSDLQLAADLCTQLGYPADASDLRPRLERIAGRDENVVLVMDEGGAVIGWIHAAIRVALESNPWLEIAGLVVNERYRSRGIGGELLDAAEHWARERGCSRSWVRSRISREAAHRFYERAGYTRLKTQYVFEKLL
jgi:GNAT superfamily N-acetyltransferase